MAGRDTESLHVEANANVNVNRFTLPKDPREIAVAVILAGSILTNIIVGWLLMGAYKDLQTQVWLRDDALTKFVQGPYADTKAHVIALELNCKR